MTFNVFFLCTVVATLLSMLTFFCLEGHQTLKTSAPQLTYCSFSLLSCQVLQTKCPENLTELKEWFDKLGNTLIRFLAESQTDTTLMSVR